MIINVISFFILLINSTLTFTLPIYLLIILLLLTLLIRGLLYNTILKKKQLKEIRNYLQYDTNATKNVISLC